MEMELLERYRVWRLRQYFRLSGTSLKIFFSFQHTAPWSLQIEAMDEFMKVHELSLLVRSEREFFTPCKHITSSSMELLREKQKIEANERIRKIFIMFYSQRFDFDFFVLLFLVWIFESE